MRTSARYKNLSARGRVGKSGNPAVYFGTSLISLKLIELESRNFWYAGRHLQVLWLRVKICPLGGVWGDQQLPVFILDPPPYLSN